MIRIFLTHNPEDLDAYYGRTLAGLEALGEVRRNPAGRNLTTPELIDAAAGCEIIVSHRATHGETALFENAPDLIAFLRCAIDIRDVDVDAAPRAGVLVANAGKSFIPSTAEIALALMLCLARNVGESTRLYRDGEMPPQTMGAQMRGRTAGIIGYGAIGSYLADLLLALGMRVLVHDPFKKVDRAQIEQVGFQNLLAAADVVLPLAPASAETENLIDAAALAAMKPTALLVNVSRGELMDEDAVATALGEGRIGGLAMDVGRAPDQRPSPALASLPGVVSTPHLGGLTPENADEQAASSVEQVRAILAGEMPPRTVNSQAAERLRAWWRKNGQGEGA